MKNDMDDDDPIRRYRRSFDAPWWRDYDFWFRIILWSILIAFVAWVVTHSGNSIAL